MTLSLLTVIDVLAEDMKSLVLAVVNLEHVLVLPTFHKIVIAQAVRFIRYFLARLLFYRQSVNAIDVVFHRRIAPQWVIVSVVKAAL